MMDPPSSEQEPPPQDESPPGDGTDLSSTNNVSDKEQIINWLKKGDLGNDGFNTLLQNEHFQFWLKTQQSVKPSRIETFNNVLQDEHFHTFLLNNEQSIMPCRIKTGAIECVSSITGNDCTLNAKLDSTQPQR